MQLCMQYYISYVLLELCVQKHVLFFGFGVRAQVVSSSGYGLGPQKVLIRSST